MSCDETFQGFPAVSKRSEGQILVPAESVGEHDASENQPRRHISPQASVPRVLFLDVCHSAHRRLPRHRLLSAIAEAACPKPGINSQMMRMQAKSKYFA